MKNKIFYLMVFALAAFTLAGCEKTTEGKTRITYYATIDLLGNLPTVTYLSDPYVEEGCEAVMKGEDVTSQVVITPNVNTNKIGVYSVSYSVTNEDGFPANTTRTVYVVDPSSIANLYLAECIFGARHFYNTPIFITDNVDGTYKIDDLIGGLQFNGINPGFEPDYDFHAEGNVAIASDNSVSQVGETGPYYFSSSQPVKLNGGTFDPETRTFNLSVNYGATAGTVILRALTK